MQIQITESTEEFLQLRGEWNKLLQSSPVDCVFLTHEWLSTWWKHLSEGRKLHIVTARQNGELAGILPVAERTSQLVRMMPRVLEFLGSGVIGSDYLDVIARKGQEQAVISAVAEHLHGHGLMLQLGQLREGSCLISALAEHMNRREWAVRKAKLNVCPYIDLRGHTWETYLATLGPKVRKNINRYLRNLSKSFDMRADFVETPVEARDALQTAVDLHSKRWGTRGTSEAFQSEAVIAFHREFVELAAESGWLRLLILRLNNTAAAALYGLFYGPTFYFYQSGFDPDYSEHSVGAAALGLSIQKAIEEGASEYDFLHGAEEYKFHWASGTRDLSRFEMHPPQTMARFYKHAIGLNRAARQVARRMLNRAA
jgi:CelD/BcsL family acetyltransferase involved in cellulose biosynthesis